MATRTSPARRGGMLELRLTPAPPPDARAVPVRAGVPFGPGALLEERNGRLLIDGREAGLFELTFRGAVSFEAVIG